MSDAPAGSVNHLPDDASLDSATITSLSAEQRREPRAASQPYLVVLTSADQPRMASSRHLLAGVDEVRLGRGPRSAARSVDAGKVILELRLPDPRMSGDHGQLVRGAAGWVLDDPASKNGSLINGTRTRHAIVGDGALIELGHCFLMFCHQPVEEGAAVDAIDGELAVASSALATFVGPLADGFAALTRIATTPISVVLLGETGTGKEVTARTLHALSGRSGAFVAVNCGALPRELIEAELFGHRRGAFTGAAAERLGLIRAAEGGTLFLDEIGELPLASQATFLRVLQEREVVPVGDDRAVKVDVRLCAATHRNLTALADRGELRRDLLARISGFTLELPPLSARRADLGLLLRSLLAGLPGGDAIQFAPSALRALLVHPWPLNIRALSKILGTAIALATHGIIELEHLTELPRAVPTRGAAPGIATVAGAARRGDDAALRERLIAALTAHRGNIVAASHAIGARRTQIYRWARRFGIDLDRFRR